MLEPEENKGDTFQQVPGNLGDFMSQIKTPHEAEAGSAESGAPLFDEVDEEPIQFDTHEEVEGGDDDAEAGRPLPTAATVRLGDALAKGCNKAIPGLYSMYSHAPAEKYMISDEELADLSQAFADYLSDVGAKVTPVQALVCAIAGSFATQIPMVIADRHEYEKSLQEDQQKEKENENN